MLRLRYLGGGFCFVGSISLMFIAFSVPASAPLTAPLAGLLVFLGVKAFRVRRPGGYGPVRTAVGWTLIAKAISWGIGLIAAIVLRDEGAIVGTALMGAFSLVAAGLVLGKPLRGAEREEWWKEMHERMREDAEQLAISLSGIDTPKYPAVKFHNNDPHLTT